MSRSIGTVLVANRGEIACRVMAALAERGIVSVAITSEADRGALHARVADRAIEVGGAPASESYLNVPRILEAAREAGADAVHPGYGFLAENASFARAVEDAGLVFLGPTPETIARLGDKREARAIARSVGVPVVPGWEGEPGDLPGATAAAESMGWPVLVKAALGGGGKGMTLVSGAGELREALEAASRVAASAFGDASVFLEKAILRPRHVEVQLLGDGAGSVLHLGERECTLQRRHQKVVEESPAPTISDATRAALSEAAVAIGREVGYRSAGTCEFLVDEDESFYFLEVNARIQVEHPVTELVTGRDLVHEQLRIGQGLAPSFGQGDVASRGAAVEARLYAEDPDRGFLPQAGELVRVEYPSGPGVRVDAGAESGDVVPTHYDPMIAKIVAYGVDRESAWRRLSRALADTVVHGPVTNLDFLRELAADPDVLAGRFHTGFLEQTFVPARAGRLERRGEDLLLATLALAETFGLDRARDDSAAATGGNGIARASDPFETLAGWRHPGLAGKAGGS